MQDVAITYWISIFDHSYQNYVPQLRSICLPAMTSAFIVKDMLTNDAQAFLIFILSVFNSLRSYQLQIILTVNRLHQT